MKQIYFRFTKIEMVNDGQRQAKRTEMCAESDFEVVGRYGNCVRLVQL